MQVTSPAAAAAGGNCTPLKWPRAYELSTYSEILTVTHLKYINNVIAIPAFQHTMASKRHEKILIVGAGYAGSYLALHLQKSGIGFAIINQSEVFHNNFASVRAIVQSGEFEILCFRSIIGSIYKKTALKRAISKH